MPRCCPLASIQFRRSDVDPGNVAGFSMSAALWIAVLERVRVVVVEVVVGVVTDVVLSCVVVY